MAPFNVGVCLQEGTLQFMNKTSQDIPLPALQVQTPFHYVSIYTNNFDKCAKLKMNLFVGQRNCHKTCH